MAFKPPKHANREQDSEEEEEEFEDSPFDSPAAGGTSLSPIETGDVDDLLDDDEDEDEGNSASRRGSNAGGRGRARNSMIIDADEDENTPPDVLNEKLTEQTAILEKVREEFNKIDDTCTVTTKQVTALSCEVSAQAKLIIMLEEQKKLLEATAFAPQTLSQLTPEEKEIIQESVRSLESKHSAAVTEHEQLKAQLAHKTEQARELIRQRNAAKPGMITQTKKVERLERLYAKAKELYTGDS